MDGNVIETLRDRLREETGDVHRRLEERMARHPVATREGLEVHLLAHALAFDALTAQGGAGASSAPVIEDLRARIAVDLGRLGVALPDPVSTPRAAFDPLAVDYVVLGSRLGARVLHKDWKSSVDPAVRAASAYFSAPARPREWQNFIRGVMSYDIAGVRAATVVEDAKRIFEVFLLALTRAERTKRNVDGSIRRCFS